MRKFLLATAAVLGCAVGMSGVAFAQATVTPTPAPGMHPGSFPPLPSGGPNTFEVHLDGRINYYVGLASSSLDNLDGTKLNTFDTQGYIRLYPGFTAETANGLQYGVASEIRMPGNTGGVAGENAGATSPGETLYWFEAYGFVGTDQLGTLRFGMSDAVPSLFQVGTFENFNDGGWNGDVEGLLPGNAIPQFAFADIGPFQTNTNITYLSPNFSGFQLGIGFSPNTSNLWNDAGCGTGAGLAQLGCNRLISQGVVTNYGRPRNTISAGVTYTNTFDGLGINGSIVGIKSATVSNTAPGGIGYDGYGVGIAGLTVSFAGVTVGGHIAGGQMNGDFGLQPKGGRQTLSWMLGAEYQTGPFIVGASYFQTQFAGNWLPGEPGVARTENDTGVAAGGTYSLAPGFELFLSYLYGTRHQPGWDFGEMEPGSEHNNVHGQVFTVGTQLSW